jgi:hypothetical protein
MQIHPQRAASVANPSHGICQRGVDIGMSGRYANATGSENAERT